MKHFLLTSICMLLSLNVAFASGSQHEEHAAGDDHKHDNLESHTHGHVKILIAVEKNIVDILMEGSADTFIGFEHRPKSKKEIKAYSTFYDGWTKSNDKIFIFPKEFNCKTRGATAGWKGNKNSKHKNLAMAAKYLCEPAIEKANLTVKLSPHLNGAAKFEIDVLPLNIMPYSKEIKKTKKLTEISLPL